MKYLTIFFFISLITTMVTLMWASLDMIALDSLDVFKDQSLIQIWTAILFTLYHAASLIVLLNMLIAMMSNSYQRVEVRILKMLGMFNNWGALATTTATATKTSVEKVTSRYFYHFAIIPIRSTCTM